MSLLANLIREASKERNIAEELNYAIHKRQHDLREDRKPRKGMFSPSSFSNSCLRNLYYRYIGTPEESENRPVLDFGPIISILQNGNDRHERLQELISTLTESGFDIEWIPVNEYLEQFNPPNTTIVEQVGFETKLYNSVLPSRFMCDGVIKAGGKYYIIEIKTMNNRKWSIASKAKAPLDEHIMQGSIYSLILGIENVLFLYENRDNMKLLPLEYKVTSNNKQTIIDIVEAVKTYVKVGALPPRSTKGQADCRYCKFKVICGNQGFTKSIFDKPAEAEGAE